MPPRACDGQQRHTEDGGDGPSRSKVLVLGGNFAGRTAALAVRHELPGDVDVRVVSASDFWKARNGYVTLP